MQDDIIIFAEKDYRVSPTKHTSIYLSPRSELASSTQEPAEPTTTVYTAPTNTGSD